MTRKPIIYTADAARIDDNEGRIAIIVDTDEGDKLYIDIHAVALDFEASVRANLRPYALEAEHARATMPELVTSRPISVEDAVEAGYALDDPKSPGYHDRMVD